MLLEIVFDFDKTDKSVEKFSQISHENKFNMFSLLHWIQHCAEITNITLPLSCRFVSEGFFGFDPFDSRVPGLKVFTTGVLGLKGFERTGSQGFGSIEFQRNQLFWILKDLEELGSEEFRCYGFQRFWEDWVWEFWSAKDPGFLSEIEQLLYSKWPESTNWWSFFTQVVFEKTSYKCC